MPREQLRDQIDTLNALNGEHLKDRPGYSELQARIATYELAFQLQTAAPEVMVIHELSGVDVHEQLAVVEIEIDPVPPLEANDNDVGDTVNAHGVTVTVAVALSSVPQPFVTRTK